MPLRLQKKASRVVRAVVEEVQVARGVGTRTDKRGNAKTALWERGKVRSRASNRRVANRETRRGVGAAIARCGEARATARAAREGGNARARGGVGARD